MPPVAEHRPLYFHGLVCPFALKPLYDALPTGGFVFLLLGGIMYTLGGVNVWP